MMNPNLPSQLPLARYRFDFSITRRLELAEYAGSALRGAFGHALKRLACTNPEHELCGTCPMSQSCHYAHIFEPPILQETGLHNLNKIPAPYVIEPPPWGEHTYEVGQVFSFHMVLMGEQAIGLLPLISLAWSHAFNMGVSGGQGILNDILYCPADAQAYSILKNQQLVDHHATVNVPADLPSELVLSFVTPLRLQSNGKVLNQHTISGSALLMQLLRRVSLVAGQYWQAPMQGDFAQLKTQAARIPNQHLLQWQDWQRYSTRQEQYMHLGGVVGHWQFKDLDSLWSSLFFIAQWLHLGKNASFGLGNYTLHSSPN